MTSCLTCDAVIMGTMLNVPSVWVCLFNNYVFQYKCKQDSSFTLGRIVIHKWNFSICVLEVASELGMYLCGSSKFHQFRLIEGEGEAVWYLVWWSNNTTTRLIPSSSLQLNEHLDRTRSFRTLLAHFTEFNHHAKLLTRDNQMGLSDANTAKSKLFMNSRPFVHYLVNEFHVSR